MRKLALVLAFGLLTACGSTAGVPLPGSLLSSPEVSSQACPAQEVMPGASGLCFAASHSAKANWMVLRLPQSPNEAFLAYSGPEGTWTFSLPLEAQGSQITKVEVEQFRTGDILDDPSPEVALLLNVESTASGGNARQSRRALYLVGVGPRRHLLWYATLSYQATLADACKTESLRYVGDVSWQMMGPLVTGVTVNQQRTSDVCSGGDGCGTARECTKLTSHDERGWVYNDEMQTFRLYGRDQGIMKIPDVGLD